MEIPPAQRGLILFSLLLAAISQLLALIDPIIFGKIIDDYAMNPGNCTEEVLIKGVMFWLGIAIAIALAARLTKAFREYTTRLALQKFGMQIFNDGLKQTYVFRSRSLKKAAAACSFF